MLKDVFLLAPESLCMWSLQRALSFMLQLCTKWYHIFSVRCACVIKPNITGLCFFHLRSCTRARVKVTSVFRVFSVFCFPGILTMSTPWMTGARPSVGCKCRSCNSWSCRYCLLLFWPKYLYVVFSWRFLWVCPTPPCPPDINHGVTRGGGGGMGVKYFCTFASNQSLKMCYACMTARKRYMKGLGQRGEDN